MPRAVRPLLLALLASLLLPAGPALAAPAVTAELLDCRAAVDPAARTARFGGTMLLGPTATRMQMRFELLVRRPGVGFVAVPAPRLGEWREASAGVARYRRRTVVQRLVVPAVYRAHVSFRWLDAAGAVVDSAERDTAVCRQPDLRPNLVVVAVVPGELRPDGRRRYDVTVRNTGRARARNVPVAIVGGSATIIKGLKAGATQSVGLVGPACSAGSATVGAVDAQDRIPESSSADNVASVSVPCPTE